MQVHEVVRQYVDAFAARDGKACAECFAKDGTYSDPGTPKPIPPQAIAELFDELFVAFPDAKTETVALDPISEMTAVWRWVIRGTNARPFRGAPATGRPIEVHGCEFIDAHDGLIRSVVGYYDRLSLLAQLGMVPAPPAQTAQ